MRTSIGLAIAVAVTVAGSCAAEGSPGSTQPGSTQVIEAATTTSPPPARVQDSPSARRSHAMVTLRPGRLLIVGGSTVSANSVAWMGDSWVYDTAGATWTQLDNVSVRGQHSLVSLGDSALLFGGYAGSDFVYGDFQSLRGDDWTAIADSNRPQARVGAVMGFDEESGLVVLFGGDFAPFDARLPTNETWTYDAANGVWDRGTPAVSPRPKSEGHPTLFELAMVYHQKADRILLMIGGDELWAYDANADAWQPRAAPGLDADFMVAAAYHAGIDRVVAYGGAPTGETQETWEYDYATDTWSRVPTATSPGPLADHAMAYDPQSDLVFMYGGSPAVLALGNPPPPSGVMWAFDGVDWRIVSGG